MSINLGDKVRDTVTGFAGIAVARTEWLHGCARICVQPDKLDKDGKVIDGVTFDEMQLEIVDRKAVPAAEMRSTGGPRNDKVALKRL